MKKRKKKEEDLKISYKNLPIGKGDIASVAFLEIALGESPDFINKKISPEEKEKTRKELLEYCKLDTEGMVRIVERLMETIKNK